VKNSPLLRGLDEIRQEMRKLGENTMRFGELLAGVGAAILAPIAASIAMFAQMGSALDDVRKRTGMSASAVAEYSYASQMAGASVDKVEGAVKKMQDTLVQATSGSESAKKALAEVGLTADQLKGKLPEEQLQMVSDGLARIQDPAKRTAIAMDVLGKSGTDLMGMFNELASLRAEARQLGLVPTEKAIKDAAAIGDLFNQIKSVSMAAIFEIGSAVGPLLTPFLEMTRNIGAATVHWVRDNGEVIRTVAKIGAGLLAAGSAIYVFGRGMNIANAGMETLYRVLAPFNIISPVLQKAAELATGLGTAAAGAFSKATSVISQGASRIASMAGSVAAAGVRMAGSIVSAAVSAGVAIRTGLMNAIARVPAAFNSIVSAARTAFASAKTLAQKFSGEFRYWMSRPFEYFKALTPLFAADLQLQIGNAMARIRSIASTAATGMRVAWTAASSAVTTVVSTMVNAISSRVNSVVGPIVSRISQMMSSVSSAIGSRISAAFSAVAGPVGAMLNRIRQRFAVIMPLLGKDISRLVGYATTAASGIVAAFRYAGPAIARGLVSVVSGAFTRIRAVGMATAAGLARGVGAGARGIGSAMSGIAGLISMAGAGAGGMLGQIAGVVPQLLMVGSSLFAALNPATLLIAAIAGGVYLWTQYSESGKAALSQMIAILQPFLDIAKRTFGGIYNAIKAHDMALAGKIALAGLKLVFLTGMENLGDLVGGTWGKAMKNIGGKIAGGDFKGAWQDALLAMGAMWDSWSAGVVKSFTKAIGFVVDIWKEGVGKISDFLLEASASGGALGAIASGILGVDMKDEKQRNNLMDEKARTNTIRAEERSIKTWQEALEKAKSAGNEPEVAKLEAAIARSQKQIENFKGGNTGPDFTKTMIQAGREAFESSNWNTRAEELKAQLKAIDDAVAAKANESNANLAANLPDTDKERMEQRAKLEAELAELIAESAKKRKEVEDAAAAAAVNPDGAGGLPDTKAIRENFGTFSGQALMLGGSDGGHAARIAKAAEEQQKLTAQLIKKADEQRASFDRAAALLNMA
jgi:phage-related protein